MSNEYRRKRELPVDHTREGKAIFGWNERGVPVCNAILANTGGLKNPDHTRRCMATITYRNGRCKKHGGTSKSGPAHGQYREGLYSRALKNTLLSDRLVKASNDPHYLELKTEIGLNAVEIANVLSNIDQGFDDQTWRRLLSLVESIEKTVFQKNVQQIIDFMDKTSGHEKLQTQVEELLSLVRIGANKSKVFRQAGEVIERRRKLVETEMKYVVQSKNNMSAEDVLNLFTMVIGVVTRVFASHPDELRIFGHEIDKMSARGDARLALDGASGVSGMIEPRSGLTEEIRKTVPPEPEFVEVEELKVFKRKIVV